MEQLDFINLQNFIVWGGSSHSSDRDDTSADFKERKLLALLIQCPEMGNQKLSKLAGAQAQHQLFLASLANQEKVVNPSNLVAIRILGWQ